MRAAIARRWVDGAVLGSIGVWVSLYGAPAGLAVAAALGGAAVLARPRPAFGAGLLVAVAVWFLYFDDRQRERCAAMNGACVVVADPILPLAIALLACGVLLTLYCVYAVRNASKRA